MRKYLYVLIAAVACACGHDEMQNPNEEENAENGNGPKTYTVSLDLKGENVEIDQEPLGRASEETNDLYWFQIDQTPEAGGSSSYYAYGIFDKKENMTVKLLEGFTYRISASLIKDGRDKLYTRGDNAFIYPVSSWSNYPTVTNAFVVTPDVYVTPNGTNTYLDNGKGSYIDSYFPEINRFYGNVDGYVPVENGKVAINLYRMMFGYRIEMEPFEEGMAVVEFLDYKDTIRAANTVTKKEREVQYSYNWEIIDKYGQNIETDAQERINNMQNTAQLLVKWISPDGKRTVIVYKDYITVQRLKRTIIKVTLKKGVAQNGSMDMKVEENEVLDGEVTSIEGNIGDGTDTDIDTGK